MAWTENDLELLRRLWLEGKSASQISAALGGHLTRNALIGKGHRLGLAGRVSFEAPSAPPVATPAPVPADIELATANYAVAPPTSRREKIIAAMKDGLNISSTIAKRVGATISHTNTALAEMKSKGLVMRRDDTFVIVRGQKAIVWELTDAGRQYAPPPKAVPLAPARRSPVAPVKPSPRASSVAVPAVVAHAVESQPIVVCAEVDEVVVPLSLKVTIVELRESMCKWPLGDPSSSEFRYCGSPAHSGTPYCSHHGKLAYQPAQDRRRRERDRRPLLIAGSAA